LCIEGKCDSKSIIRRDADVNRLYFLGCRVIKNAMENPAVMRELDTNLWHIANHRSVLIRIEEIADTQKRVSRLLSNAQLGDETLLGIKEISEDIKSSYSSVMKSYYTNDKKIALEIEINHESLIEKCNNFLENASKHFSAEIKDSRQLGMLYKKNTDIANIAGFKKSALSYIRRIARIVLSMD
jgi:phosphate uptake regulator